MTTKQSAAQPWTIGPSRPDHADSVALRRDYLAELIARYFGRPAEESEIDEHLGEDAELLEPRGAFLVARTVAGADAPGVTGVAGAAGAAVGCVGLRWLAPGTAELTRVFVRAEARRDGAGARLVGAAEELARSRGVRHMLLNTRKDLTEAIALYHRLGYRPTDPYGDDPHAEVWLAKDLAV